MSAKDCNIIFDRQRDALLKASEKFITSLIRHNNIKSLYITGSFITEKPHPEDIDLYITFSKNTSETQIDEILNNIPEKVDIRLATIETERGICPVYRKNNRIIINHNDCEHQSHYIDVLEDFMECEYGKRFRLFKLK